MKNIMTKVERVLSWDGNSRTGPNLNWGCLILLVKVVFRIHLIHANEMLTRLKKMTCVNISLVPATTLISTYRTNSESVIFEWVWVS